MLKTVVALTGSMMLALAAWATPVVTIPDQADDQEALEEFNAALEEVRALMLRPGDRVEGWDRGGAHPDEHVRALGAGNYYLLSRDENGTGVTILTDRPVASFAPPTWRVADSYGAPGERLDHPQIEFHQFSPRYVVGARSGGWLQNDASCFRNVSHAVLYDIPGSPGSADDEIVPAIFRIMLTAFEDQTICQRFDGNPRQGWRQRQFLPDGRLLPELNRSETLVTIVPAAPIDQLIAPPPDPVTEPTD